MTVSPCRQTKAQLESALEAEMTEYLGHDKHETVTNASGNACNGKSHKPLKDEAICPTRFPVTGKAASSHSSSPKHHSRWNSFDDKIIKSRGSFPNDDSSMKL